MVREQGPQKNRSARVVVRVSIGGERECDVWEAGRSWLLQFEMWLGTALAFSEVLVVSNGTRSGA